jgi:hypothetical protein
MSLAFLYALLIPIGLFFGAFFGVRAGLSLIKQYKWAPMIIGSILLLGMSVIAIMTGGEVGDSVRPVLATVLGFAGGLIYITRENIYR